VQSPRARRTRAGHHDVRDRRRVSDRRAVIVEIPGPGHALVVDSGWREVAHTALFVQRIVRSGAG
jgi:non-heme chloroperoxidase